MRPRVLAITADGLGAALMTHLPTAATRVDKLRRVMANLARIASPVVDAAVNGTITYLPTYRRSKRSSSA